jgi:hypothetical protein
MVEKEFYPFQLSGLAGVWAKKPVVVLVFGGLLVLFSRVDKEFYEP